MASMAMSRMLLLKEAGMLDVEMSEGETRFKNRRLGDVREEDHGKQSERISCQSRWSEGSQ